ncbi:hypothetical protein [Halococcoides cellulosivorans]|uniref:Uncharacterized protein n=1 Tax=Halococcoides cellulosivorans TaxID=1679096 RepID=A0A2R4X3S1_9EURY|nr:hypothetical protein [Halococcoides cellulosivorans]AWB28442.1 hypothetical protein HARCEL1_12400 [Halococcoides cellulosivorans]
MVLLELHVRVKHSKYKPWQVYLLAAAIILCLILYFDIGPLTDTLRSLEAAASGFQWVVILAIQGVLIGFVAEYLYEQGDEYAKVGSNEFDSKDKTLVARVGIMTGVSAVITLAVPNVVRTAAEYLVIQTVGAVIVLGILLVHESSSDWNPKTELPGLVAGLLLAVAPTVL